MRAWALSIACAAMFAAQAARAQITPLFVIPTESLADVAIPDDLPVRVSLVSNDAPALAEKLGVKAVANTGSFEYVIGAYPQLASTSSRTWLEPTFMIDFDQPEFAGVRAEMAGLGAKPTRAQLISFVNRTIDESTQRGWDFASAVAKKRQGDCSEHAVFTAALARMYGIPARVVVGVALIAHGKDYGAYGHAWAETLENGNWVIADASLLDTAPNARYLPLGLVEDEGIGFKMSLAGLSSRWIQKLVVLGPAN
jgi:transglutaminase-like putative cysteine protease